MSIDNTVFVKSEYTFIMIYPFLFACLSLYECSNEVQGNKKGAIKQRSLFDKHYCFNFIASLRLALKSL